MHAIDNGWLGRVVRIDGKRGTAFSRDLGSQFGCTLVCSKGVKVCICVVLIVDGVCGGWVTSLGCGQRSQTHSTMSGYMKAMVEVGSGGVK